MRVFSFLYEEKFVGENEEGNETAEQGVYVLRTRDREPSNQKMVPKQQMLEKGSSRATPPQQRNANMFHPENIMQLQKMFGNRAVTQWLKSALQVQSKTTPESQAPIQMVRFRSGSNDKWQTVEPWDIPLEMARNLVTGRFSTEWEVGDNDIQLLRQRVEDGEAFQAFLESEARNQDQHQSSQSNLNEPSAKRSKITSEPHVTPDLPTSLQQPKSPSPFEFRVKDGVIHGIELVRMPNQIVREFFKKVNVGAKLEESNGRYQILSGPDWLRTAGRMAIVRESTGYQPTAPGVANIVGTESETTIEVGRNKSAMTLFWLKNSSTERLRFSGGTDLSYPAIIEEINRIKKFTK